MQCSTNEQSLRTNELRAIIAHHVRTKEWRVVNARYVVVDVMSQRVRLRGEMRVDNGL